MLITAQNGSEAPVASFMATQGVANEGEPFPDEKVPQIGTFSPVPEEGLEPPTRGL